MAPSGIPKKTPKSRTHPQIAIITGDVVQSTRLTGGEREILTRALEGISGALKSVGIVAVSADIFRGDSFQIVLKEARHICDASLYLRAWFRSTRVHDNSVLDVRLGLGLGQVEYQSKKQSLSDGTAYRLAAASLEDTFTDKLSRVKFCCESPALAVHVNAIFVAIEPDVSKWTAPQAQSIWWSLQGLTHVEIAEKLDVAQSTVTRALQSAQSRTLEYIRNYLRDLIDAYLSPK